MAAQEEVLRFDVAMNDAEIVKVLEGEGQAICTIARSSTAMKLDYHLSLCYPSDIRDAVSEMDRILVTMVNTGIIIY